MTLKTFQVAGASVTYEGEAQLHLSRLEILFALAGGLSVLDRVQTGPPRRPGVGHRYLVASPATGAFTDHEDQVAVWVGDAWAFLQPYAGLVVWDEDAAESVRFNGLTWEPVVTSIAGSAFPSSPQAGQVFTRTDLNYEPFVWDAGRSKWLSLRTVMAAFTNQASVLAGGYLRLFQGPFSSANYGFRLPWDATLVEISSSKNDNTLACNLEVTAGGSTSHTHSMGSGYSTQETGINVNFSSGAVVGLRVATGHTFTTGGSVHLLFRRRSS